MSSDYGYVPQYDFGMGSYSTPPTDYTSMITPYMSAAVPDYGSTAYWQGTPSDFSVPQYDSYSPPSMDYTSMIMPYTSAASPEFGAGQYAMPNAPSMEQGQGFWGKATDELGKWALEHPDRALGGAMGVLSGIGGMMNARSANKMARKAQKRNDRLSAYEKKQMERMSKNQEIADRYANSIDVTTPNSVATNFNKPASYYENYGEMTGGKDPFVTVTPGETTRVQLAHGGQVNQFVSGGAMSGQADNVPAMLSDGEYVFDADSVAALGDGNSTAGAGALDQMRQAIRQHKRSGPTSKIPPKAKPALSYLPKRKKGRK